MRRARRRTNPVRERFEVEEDVGWHYGLAGWISSRFVFTLVVKNVVEWCLEGEVEKLDLLEDCIPDSVIQLPVSPTKEHCIKQVKAFPPALTDAMERRRDPDRRRMEARMKVRGGNGGKEGQTQ